MLDLIGWARTTGTTFTLTALVGRPAGQYTVIAGDAWQPVAGDVMEDPNGLIDTVVSVDPVTPTEFTGVNEHAGWTDGFAIITRKVGARPGTVNIKGPVTAFDDPVAGVTVLGLGAEYTIAAAMSANGRLNPTGFPYASVIEVSPAIDLLEIESAMWFAPQGIKLVTNVHAVNRFVIKHEDTGKDITQALFFTNDEDDITVGPGESVALIRDTLGSNDRWRAVRNGPTLGPLLLWEAGTFGNASVRYIWDAAGKVLYGPFAGGTAAIAIIDSKRRYQSEKARTNRIPDLGSFTETGSATATIGETDPAAGSTAYLLAGIGSAGANDIRDDAANGTNNQAVGVGFFMKKVGSSAAVVTVHAVTGASDGDWDIDMTALSTGWERITQDHPAVTENNPFVNDGSGDMGFIFFNDGVDKPSNVEVWLPQIPDETFLSSPIAGGATRATDSMTFTSGQQPAALRGDVWSIDVTTMHASTDLTTSQVMYLLYFDANNFLALRENGSGTVQAILATTTGDLDKAITYSRDQTLTITVDFNNQTMNIAGATTGDGTDSGLVSDWPSATLYVGSDSGPSNHIFGRLSEPTAAAPVIPPP